MFATGDGLMGGLTGGLMGGLFDLVFLQGGVITKRNLQEHLLEQFRESLVSAAMREIACYPGKPC